MAAMHVADLERISSAALAGADAENVALFPLAKRFLPPFDLERVEKLARFADVRFPGDRVWPTDLERPGLAELVRAAETQPLHDASDDCA